MRLSAQHTARDRPPSSAATVPDSLPMGGIPFLLLPEEIPSCSSERARSGWAAAHRVLKRNTGRTRRSRRCTGRPARRARPAGSATRRVAPGATAAASPGGSRRVRTLGRCRRATGRIRAAGRSAPAPGRHSPPRVRRWPAAAGRRAASGGCRGRERPAGGRRDPAGSGRERRWRRPGPGSGRYRAMPSTGGPRRPTPSPVGAWRRAILPTWCGVNRFEADVGSPL